MDYHEPVKRLPIIGLILAFAVAAPAAAQVRGIPASATSPHQGGLVLTPGGIPASVASPGPRGYVTFSPDFRPVGPPTRDRLNRVHLRTPVPLFYAVPIYEVAYLPVGQGENSYRVVEPPTTRGEPARVIVEIRDTRSQPAPEPKPAPAAGPTPAAAPEPELPRVATIFIFQDGSRKELKDFAITATELIELTDGLIKRSPLASLDRAATLKANGENGVQVHLPNSASD